MLVTDLHTLQTIHTLYLSEHVILNSFNTFDLQDVVRIYASFRKLVAGFQNISVQNFDP